MSPMAPAIIANTDIEDIFGTLQMTCNNGTMSHCFSLQCFSDTWHELQTFNTRGLKLKFGVVST